MKKNNKIMIILIVILIVYFLVFFFLLGGSKRVSKEKNELTLIVGQNTMWTYSKKHWTNITLDKSISELNWQKYKVYINNKKLGNYYMWYDNNEWYLFDKDRNSTNYTGELFAYSSNYNLKLHKFNTKDIEDYSYVKKILNSKNIDFNEDELVVNSEVNIDIDKDNELETFYIISNSSIDSNTDKPNYTIIFMVKNNKTYNMYSEIRENNIMSCLPYINKFIDVDSDNKLETIVSCDSLTPDDNKNFLYKFTKENKYKILISNR